MEKYSGNQKGFIYASCDTKDREAVFEKYLGPVAESDISFCWGDAFDKKEEDNIARSNAVLLFLTKDYARDDKLRKTVEAAVRNDKPILTVYLEDVDLDAGLSMQLESQQALFRSRYKSDEEFTEELKKAAIFDKIEVTEQQKKKQKSRSVIAIAAAVIAVLVLAIVISPLLGTDSERDTMEALGLQGLSKEDLASIEELYVVGSEVLDHDAAASYEGGNASTIIYEVSDDETLTTPAGTISDLTAMQQLENLKVLQLSGQKIETAGELGKLKHLQALILSCNPLTDLDGTEDLSLDVLDISYTDVEEIPVGLHVREINADDSKLRKIPDFGGLSDVELYAGNTLISDVSNIGTAANYTNLHIDCGNADIGQVAEGLKGIPVETLALTDMQTDDLTILSYIDAEETVSLGLGAGSMSSLDGVEHFAGLTDLQIEYCDQLTDLSGLNELQDLERVRISRNMSNLADVLDDRIEVQFID